MPMNSDEPNAFAAPSGARYKPAPDKEGVRVMARAFDTNRLDEIGRSLGLDAQKRRELASLVIGISEAIGAYRSSVDQRMPRRERNKMLRGMSKALGDVEMILTRLAAPEGRTLSRIYAAMLGHQLSNAGLEAAWGRAISWPDPSFRLLESREAQEREGPYRVLEREQYQPVRESIIRAHTPEVLQGLLWQLRQRLDAFLALDREHNTGGAKGKPYRRYAIAVLAEAFPSLFGVKPTSSPGGTFCTLCDHVLPELGEDTEGLETAIQRVLKEVRA